MEDTQKVSPVALQALIESWQRERVSRLDLADGMATPGNKGYQQGYADALDSCVHVLELLACDP